MSIKFCGWLVLLCCLIELKRTIGFVNNPKFIVKDGHLVIESGLNRNISFQLNGNSRLIINDKWDLLSLLRQQNPTRNSDENFNEQFLLNLRELNSLFVGIKASVNGAHGIEYRLQELENSTLTRNDLLRRYRSKLRRLDVRLNALKDQLELDNCKNNPCENGGTCYNLFSGFICKCPSNFEGTKCEQDVNECALYAGTDLGCQNGAECVNQLGSYSCICSTGWFGIHCTQRRDCMHSSAWELCGHGTCVSSSGSHGYKCICDQGWKTNDLTPACMVDVDECSVSEARPPCATKCINLPGSFMCAPCPPGLTGNGLTCRDIDECSINNGGCSLNPLVNCINTHGSYQCHECPLGWTGDGRTCTRSQENDDDNTGNNGVSSRSCTSKNICHPSASCMEISNSVVCTCPAEMVGNGIGPYGCTPRKQINCNDLPCLNGGTCVDKDNGKGYECICSNGYQQPNCASTIDPCANRPCANNGVCRAMNSTMYQCHCMPGYSGQLCQTLVASRCGGVLSGPTGQLQYPANNTVYESNSQCAWVIRTTETQVLNITFDSFQLEETSECRTDWLQINDGRTAAAQVIGRFCGIHKPMNGNIISSTNFVYLWFRTGNSSAKASFNLHWNSILPQCGGIVSFTTHGTIASPGSPGNYPKNRDCHWHLQAPNDKRIKLTFFNLGIENHDSCNYDYLEITDIISKQVLAKYCKSTHPEPLLLPTNDVDIHFHSDGENSDVGFQIYYSTDVPLPGCGGVFNELEGVIKSPENTLDRIISCEYDITVPAGSSIMIEFVMLELSGPEECIEFYDIDEKNHIEALQSKYCGGYDVKPTKLNSLYHAMRIKSYSITSKFEIVYRTDCSYTFENERGTIISPNYPTRLPIEYSCTYTIQTAPGTQIALHMIDFDLKYNTTDEDIECTFTALTINDELNKLIGGPFCGNNTPDVDILSKANSLQLRFRTITTSIGRGFKANYEALPMNENGCGGIYSLPEQSIRLPTTDGYYKYDMECYWFIKAPVNKGIRLVWKSMILEDSSICLYDYVDVYDSLENMQNNKLLARYCGIKTPPSLMSHSSMLILKFVSDSDTPGEGFELNYEFIDKNQCGGNIHSSNGILTSPDYPKNYTNGIECKWIITAPMNTQIELQIEMFELEATKQCDGDWLEVRNGGSEQSHQIGRFCGSVIPHVIPSFTHQMFIFFHSNNFVNAKGFKIRWYVFSNNCGGDLVSNSGVITSPNYPNEYPNNAQCEWLIHVSKGSAIQITVEDMEFEELYDCEPDRLQIFGGHNTDKIEMELCNLPNGQPHKITVVNHEALIRFESDASISEKGFLLSYESLCTITLSEMFGVIESPNYNNPYYTSDINCAWTIIAPKGNRLLLEITYFNSNENGGAIYFVEKLKSNITYVMKNKQQFNSSNELVTVLQNSSDVSFRLEYKIHGCVQHFSRDSGEFKSPKYPFTYPDDIECMWIIKTNLGKGIEFTINNMDIEETVNCTNDALIISSNAYSHNVKERHCGNQNTALVITSSSHHMFVRFVSNAQRNGKGFTAKYRTIQTPCGGILKSRNGVIESPNYPSHYPPDSDCEWIITVTTGHTITLTLEELDLEEYYDCDFDFVSAYEYNENLTDTNENKDDDNEYEYETFGEDNNEHLLFTKCGSLADNDVMQWTTSTNKAIIRFRSDNSRQSKGFKLTYQENCGQHLVISNDDYGELEITRTSNENRTCVWEIIAADKSKRIMLKVTHVHLSPLEIQNYKTEDDCIEHGVKIYDGVNEKGPISKKFCKIHPPDIISNGHAITIVVPLNIIWEFAAEYTVMDTMCGGEYKSLQGTFSTPYYPGSYPDYIDCDWLLIASEGNSYVLTFESISIQESEDCNKDYVEIRDDNSRGRLLGIICGSTSAYPQPFVAQRMWIRFSTDGDGIVGQGFIASYNYVSHNELNGTGGIIESPHYPSLFHTQQPYSWRILVEREYVVILTIMHLDNTDRSYIKFYDGYVDIGEPIDYSDSHIIRSHTSALYITATRGPFRFEWKALSKEALSSNYTAEQLAEQCGTSVITVENAADLKSPGFPNGYDINMNCSWRIIPNNPAVHAVLSFTTIDLEDFQYCATDYVSISSSSDLQNWKLLDKLCKKSNTTQQKYHGTPYLKVDFITDTSINKTGYASIIHTECGSEMFEHNGFVNITDILMKTPGTQATCIWTIRGREGRRIRITFPNSELQNLNENDCHTYFIVRNGINEDSPFLGRGKFCNNNITESLETSSKWAYIKFVLGTPWMKQISFHYEEIEHECSDEIQLSAETAFDRMKTITTPHYPNIPNPHSECIWRITAPPHSVIAISFTGRFDLADEKNCEHEYVQLNDGSTELMPSLGRYCGAKKPDTQYSSGNVLRVKYFTDLSEPHLGFMANISIGQCGGSYFQNEGIINSPQRLTLRNNDTNFECVYIIEVERGHTINLTIDKLDLPYDVNCSSVTHLELQEINRNGDEEFTSDTLHLCGGDEKRLFIVETNKLVVHYKIVGDVQLSYGFRLIYNAVGDRCGEEIIASSGSLQSPNYPDAVQRPTHCVWLITVPKGRRIKVDFIDIDIGAVDNSSRYSSHSYSHIFGRILFANDFELQSIIARISSMQSPSTPIYSTDNTMAIDVFLMPFGRHRGFRLRFSSEEENTLCRATIRNSNLIHYDADHDNTSIYCRYIANVPPDSTLALHVLKYEHNASIFSTYPDELCKHYSPFKLQLISGEWLASDLCSSENLPTFRLPYSVAIILMATNRNKLRLLEFDYQRHKCGGLLSVDIANVLNITQPSIDIDNDINVNSKVECAWLVGYTLDATALSYDKFEMDGIQLELTVEMDMKGNCDNEYLQIYNGPNHNAPTLGRYCGRASATNLVVERGVFIEYYVANYDLNSTFTVTINHGSGCGGILKHPYRRLVFDGFYANNLECVWEIVTDPGFYITLTFVGRFFIESSPNCTKDYILVQEQQKNGNEWNDLKRICGREPPLGVNTTTTRMRFIFRSDNETFGDGFIAQFDRHCGGTYYANNEEQHLISPGYPVEYNHNLACDYTILPSRTIDSNTGIMVRFLDFELEEPPILRCIFDNVTVKTWDDNSSEPANSAILCGTNKRNIFQAKERISIILRTDSTFASKGFKLAYSTNTCGGNVTNTTLIKSPQHPETNKLPHNSDCFWNITAPEGYKIYIKFEILDFEYILGRCDYDAVEVYRGLEPKESARLGRFCGNFSGHQLPELSIPSNTALVHTFSDHRDSSSGFAAIVAFKPYCDKHIFLGANNNSYDFNMYANGYANNLDCEIIISTDPGRQLLMKFYKFHVEDSEDCLNDFVELRDGAGIFSDKIARLCGHNMPAQLMSSQNMVYIRFVSDEEDTSSGFGISISSEPQLCGRHNMHIYGSEHVTLKAPQNTNGKYLQNLNCYWNIKSEKNIHVHFDKLDIEGPNENGTCIGDYLKIRRNTNTDMTERDNAVFIGNLYDGGNMFVPELIYCGNVIPNDLYLDSNEINIKFITNGQNEGTGFSLTATEVNGCFKNFTRLQGRISLSETVDHCDIYITVPSNYTLTLYYKKLDFFEFDCELAFMEVFDAVTNKTLQKNCGFSDGGKNLYSNSSSLRLNIKLNEVFAKVDLTYLASNEGPGCGGELYNSEGIITSPFYPNNVREYSNCRWHIRVPSNLYVLLYFADFNMGAKTTCQTDYMQIIEHSKTGNERVVRQYCGEDNPNIYKSSSNYITVYFHKTVNFDGNGWRVTFKAIHPEAEPQEGLYYTIFG